MLKKSFGNQPNTVEFAKQGVVKKVLTYPDDLTQKMIYVAEPINESSETWRAVLIDSQTQTGKV
jgi:hypothetical protein